MTELLISSFIKDKSNIENPTVRSAYGKMASIVGIICNLLISVGKITIGLVIGSVAITADGVNNFADASSSVISLLGFKMASKPADEEHPYGHGRYEYLSAMLVAVFVMVIGVELLGSGVEKIFNPGKVDFGIVTAVILIVSTMIKLWLMVFYKKIGTKINSKALLAASMDSRNDVIATLAVLIGSVLSQYTSLEADGYLGTAVALFILYSSIGLVKDTFDPMLGLAPDPKFVESIRQKIMSYPEVLGIHDLMIHDYGPRRQFGSVHVEMAAEGNSIEHHDIIDNIERDCMENLGLHIIIHYDPIVTSDAATNEFRAWLSTIVKEKLGTDLSIHDLRTVPGTSHTNAIFDIAAPYSFPMSDAELKKALREIVNEKYPNHYLVITVDRVHAYMPH